MAPIKPALSGTLVEGLQGRFIADSYGNLCRPCWETLAERGEKQVRFRAAVSCKPPNAGTTGIITACTLGLSGRGVPAVSTSQPQSLACVSYPQVACRSALLPASAILAEHLGYLAPWSVAGDADRSSRYPSG